MTARAQRQPFTNRDRRIRAALVAAVTIGAVLVAFVYSQPDDGYRHNWTHIVIPVLLTFFGYLSLWRIRRAVMQMAPGPGPKPSGPTGPGDNRPPAGPMNPPPPKARARVIAALAVTTTLLLTALLVVAAGYAFPASKHAAAPVTWTVSFQFRDNHPGDNAARYYAAVATTDGARWYFSTAGGLGLTRIDANSDPGESWQLPAGINPNDGAWHAFTGRVRQNGGDVEVSLWLDGVLIGHDPHVMTAHVAPVTAVGRGGKPYASASNEFQLSALAVT